MKMIRQLSIILLFSVLGEGVRLALDLPVPGSILGIIFLFLAFQFKLLKPADIAETGNFLLNNLTILFVPAGVGLMKYYDVIQFTWPILLGAVILCTVISLVAVGKTAELLEKFGQKKKIGDVVEYLEEETLRGEEHDLSAGE